ncbi:ATP-binding protein [Streptomyces sp. Tu 6176]|uniref:ATP-binding protein n=1 Tax=Streptomyces sp. Tu 6176 TaxID=1470557 RepID=UPI000996E890|nr:AAA family ATPase [Streptomyces sp. Tu 6176]
MEQPTAHDAPDAVPVRVPRLVGRRAELEQVVGALSRGPATVLVEGEAGVGKSRLLQEALGTPAVRARGPLVAVCPPFEEALTLGPVVDAVRQSRTGPAGLELTALAGALRPLFPEWAHALPPAPEPLHDAGAARHRLFRALAELLDRLGTEILVVEDVHWADDATLGFLLFVAARRPRRISLVVTYRPEETAAGSPLLRLSARPAVGAAHVRLCLAPLTVAGTAALVSSMLDDEHVSDAFARFLHRRTEGLPLAVEESVRLLRDRSDLVRSRGEWVRRTLEDISVPPTIRDAVLERFARLDPDVQEVLRAAAVLTEPADDRLVARVGGSPGRVPRPPWRRPCAAACWWRTPRGSCGSGMCWPPARCTTPSPPGGAAPCTWRPGAPWRTPSRRRWPGWPTTSGRAGTRHAGAGTPSGPGISRWPRATTGRRSRWCTASSTRARCPRRTWCGCAGSSPSSPSPATGAVPTWSAPCAHCWTTRAWTPPNAGWCGSSWAGCCCMSGSTTRARPSWSARCPNSPTGRWRRRPR